MIVTVEREYGCGGEEISRGLAERLQIPLLNGEVLRERAEKAGCYEELQSFLEEEPVNSLLYSIAAETGEFLGRQPSEQIKRLIPEKNFILVGRCGNMIFADRADRVSVLIHGKKEDRAAAAAEKEGISDRAAHRKIQKYDEQRANFYRYYTGKDWGLASDYDLSLDGIRIGTQGCVEMILAFVEKLNLTEKI